MVEVCRTKRERPEEGAGGADLGLVPEILVNPASSVVHPSDLPERAQPEDLRDDPVAAISWHKARGFGGTHADEPVADPVWECRKRRSEVEGADGLSGDSMSL